MGRIVQLNQVTKSFGDDRGHPTAGPGQIEDGEFTVFVGPSGCGKSTLLRLIAGLGGRHERPVIEIDGQDATDSGPPAKRGLAMVFQSYALYPHMSVRKNIAFPLKHGGFIDKAEQDARRIEAGREGPEPDRLSRPPPGAAYPAASASVSPSGSAIVREPAAFLFDEPLSNLDAALRVGMRLEISELHESPRRQR